MTSHRWRRFTTFLVILSFVMLGTLVVGQPVTEQPKEKADKQMMLRPLPLDEALVKARVNGKYALLLRQFKSEKDADPAKEVVDKGFTNVSEYGNETDIPAGFWVYVYPYWYVWKHEAAKPIAKRSWGPEQVVGEPDTIGPGDIQSAWASKTQDEEDEWLLCEYAAPFVPTAVAIYETYNPGALARVTAFKLDGTEVEVWRGEDPTANDAGHGVSVIPIKVDFKVNRVRVHFLSTEVSGWNEIDAVGLIDAEGRTHWATGVEASTTYANDNMAIDNIPPVPRPVMNERIEQLEMEVRELKTTVEDLRKALRTSVDEIKELLKKQKQP